jgi:WD40 repeat protein
MHSREHPHYSLCLVPTACVQIMPLAKFESDLHSCCATFSQDGVCVFVGYLDGSLQCIDLTRLSIAWSTSRHSCPVVGMSCNRDGTSILTASQDGTLAVTAAESGEAVHLVRGLLDYSKGIPLDCVAVTLPSPAVLGAAWANGFAVATTPWDGGPLHVMASHSVPSTDASATVRIPPYAWRDGL